MFEHCTAALCSHHKLVIYAFTVIVGVVATILANWWRHAGPFKKAYTFVGAELATASIVAGAGLLIVLTYAAACAGETTVEFLRSHATPENLAKPGLIAINLRLLWYCKNQERRALVSGVTFTRGMRNTFVGAMAFTLALLAF
jgi:hypothetical protein